MFSLIVTVPTKLTGVVSIALYSAPVPTSCEPVEAVRLLRAAIPPTTSLKLILGVSLLVVTALTIKLCVPTTLSLTVPLKVTNGSSDKRTRVGPLLLLSPTSTAPL